MGTWGDTLYADDEAADARDSYKGLLAKGFDGPDATDRFLALWAESLGDPDDGPVAWFALADTQWALGRLEDRVRDKAVALIGDGSSLDRWRQAGPKEVGKRRTVLAALRERLLAPQPPRKAVKVKVPTKVAAWKAGELFAFRLRSGRSVVLCLEHVDEGHHARLSALDWVGDPPPPAATLAALPRKRFRGFARGGEAYTHWHAIAVRKRDVPYGRMARLDVSIPTAPEEERFGVTQQWGGLDETLETFFRWT